MSRIARIAVLASVVFLVFSFPAFAQPPAEAVEPAGEGTGERALIEFSAAIGAAVTIIGAGWGIGRIGAAAVESMARQPEVARQINTAMIIAAALIEGVTFFALIVCFMQVGE